MFDTFSPPVRATIDAFFKERHLAATADDHALELATELELQHLDLSVGDAERIAREAVAERLASSRDDVKAVSSSAMGAEGRGDSERPRGCIAGAFLANGFPKRKPRRRWGWWRGFNGRLAKEG